MIADMATPNAIPAGSSDASAAITPAATNVYPASRCVARQTVSLSIVHGVLIPIHQFERTRGR